ncbi:hypothetical protein ABT150_26660 [Streptomyces mirabilis]|uniref:hypothetical protein n=1 Tax=Streptomyces mirabilis TaxID=68239 RepID=UPI00331F3418
MDHETVVVQGWQALEATRKFGERALREPLRVPAPDSEAAVELANIENGQNGPWGEGGGTAADRVCGGESDDDGRPGRLGEPAAVARCPDAGDRSDRHRALRGRDRFDGVVVDGVGNGVRRRACRELVLSLTSARRAGQLAKDVEASEAVAETMADTEEEVVEFPVPGRVHEVVDHAGRLPGP